MLEVNSQPPKTVIFKHTVETDSLIKNSSSVKNTIPRVIKFREELENTGNFQVSDQSVFSEADEFFEKAVQKADKKDLSAAKDLENAALQKYLLIAINDLVKGLNDNIRSELTANRSVIGSGKYSEGMKELDAIEILIKQFSFEKSSLSAFLQEINLKIKQLFDKLGIIQSSPANLVMADFVIFHDKGHLQVERDYIHGFSILTGTGRLKYCCNLLCKSFKPGYISDKTPVGSIENLNSFEFTVVKKVRSAKDEILLEDALLIDPSAKRGRKVMLELVANKESQDDIIQEKESLLNALKYSDSEDIPINFNDLKVVRTKMETVGRVVEGFAFYSVINDKKTRPFEVSLPSNFVLSFDSLILSPDFCKVNAKLYLPNSLTRGADCSAAWLDIGLININKRCEFYKELVTNKYGPIEIGTTNMNISGTGYIIDFSSAKSFTSIIQDNNWKGVILLNGQTKGTTAVVISNIGYLQAKYSFTNAFITSSGLKATFNLSAPFKYKTLLPSGYQIQFNNALVKLDSSDIEGGNLQNGSVSLPVTAVLDHLQSQIQVTFTDLQIYRNRNIYGNVSTPDFISWGEYTKEGLKAYATSMDKNITGYLYFSGKSRPAYLPVSGSTFNAEIKSYSYHYLDSVGLSGATFTSVKDFSVFTPDIPNTSAPLFFNRMFNAWINILSNGVNARIESSGPEKNTELGPVNSSQYVCPGVPFILLGIADPFYIEKDALKRPNFIMNFVESAVFRSDLKGYLKIGGPSKINLAFKEMLFTSTSQNAGGKVDLSTPAKLDYWGVELVQKPGFSNGGLVCVKTGQVILSASGLAEKRHFLTPFYLTWGEMLATGDMGRLFFDYNTGGQQFDGFNFVPFTVALSKADTVRFHNGYLKAAGDVHFPFFGGDYLNINDWKSDSLSAPYNSRRIKLSNTTEFNTRPSVTNISGNWAGNLGIFKYDIMYSADDQDGFTGTGTAGLQYIANSLIASTVVLKSTGQCISLKDPTSSNHTLAIGPVANFGITNNLWGCGCIVNDQLKELVLGGEITTAANISVAVRSAGNLTFTFLVSPSVSQMTLDGIAYLSIAASFDVEANGHFALTVDRGNNFIDGNISAILKVSTIGSSPIEANGDVNWHFGGAGNNFSQYVQGFLNMNVLSETAQGGFYMGYNAPKSKAWVLDGPDPRYRLNKGAMPEYLNGVYGYILYGKGFDFFLFSGGIDIFAGVGVFYLSPQQVNDLGANSSGLAIPLVPYIVGNLGGSIHGEILAGFVSASASINLQLIAPYPGSFEGTVSLKGCVLWVACKSVSLTVGLNTSDGLYIK
jgi:hypothetical protein